MESVKEEIVSRLDEIKQDEQVEILYACESGSRAWGFASADSDYDVRFLYLRPRSWYLSINLERKRDVIELPIRRGLDISGWDLRKALQLFQRSNPPLLEWLGSPIIYLKTFTITDKMRELAKICYSPIACQYHYFKMARGNYRDYLQGDQVWVKKYFYVLRPILAVIWLERNLGIVPTEFSRLVDGVVESANLRQAISDLVALKLAGNELDQGPPIPVISNFIESELERMEASEFDKRVGECPSEDLDNLFREALDEIWGE